MNPRHLTPSHAAVASVLEARFAFRVASMLSERSDTLPHDVAERLKFARKQALERVQHSRALSTASAPAVQVQRNASLTLSGGGSPRWLRWASVVPLVALVVGLVMIQNEHSHAQIAAAADVDAALLVDELPPTAYKDAGFVEYLKTPRN